MCSVLKKNYLLVLTKILFFFSFNLIIYILIFFIIALRQDLFLLVLVVFFLQSVQIIKKKLKLSNFIKNNYIIKLYKKRTNLNKILK